MKKIVVLPCKIGTKLYPLKYGLYPELKVVSVQYTLDRDYVDLEIEAEGAYGEGYDVFELNDINKTVFFSKRKRDRALKRHIKKDEKEINKQ